MPNYVGVDQKAIEDWLAWLAAGDPSPATLRVRRALIGVASREFNLLDADSEQLAAFLASRPGQAWSKSGYRSTLRGFYAWLRATGRRDDDPASGLPRLRVPKGHPRPCPTDVLQAALDVCPDNKIRFMILLGAFAGMRRSEIAGLHSSQVTDTHLVILGKGRKIRRIPIHPHLRPHLNFTGWAFPSERKPGEHLHPDTIANRVKAALATGHTTHTLRHSAATRWYQASKDLRAVQELLGHDDPSTTARYAGVDDDALTVTVQSIA